MKKVEKKMEIEDLAVMVQRGFEDMRQGFRADLRDVESRLGDKIEAVDMRLGSYILDTDKRFDDTHEWVSELDGRVNKVEDKLAKVR